MCLQTLKFFFITSQKIIKPVIVISAVNLVEGGPLSILEEAVEAFVNSFSNSYELIVIVNNKGLLQKYKHRVKLLEFRYPKKSWIFRIWFEYVHCLSISKKIKADLWIALHDMTPNVYCKNQVVYCHNAAAFYRPRLKEIWFEKKLIFFALFYSLFYRINIKKNSFVIVQQQWLCSKFIKHYNIRNAVVAHPQVHVPAILPVASLRNKYSFFYPSYPRAFKNFEVLLEAASILNKQRNDFEVLITVKGNENKYSRSLFRKYGHLNFIKFLGIQKREDIWKLYSECHCLVFASRLETWGLPVSEMKFFHKPIIAAKTLYTAESIGNYDKFHSFELDDYTELSHLMNDAIDDKLTYEKNRLYKVKEPVIEKWKHLYSYLFNSLLENEKVAGISEKQIEILSV